MITESDEYSSDDDEKASTSRAQAKQASLQPYIKDTVINFLSSKISNRNVSSRVL
jgi:hypothetical protein